jgi:hypothetical protein
VGADRKSLCAARVGAAVRPVPAPPLSALLLASLLLAGCSGQDPAPAGAPSTSPAASAGALGAGANATAAPEAPVDLALAGCFQMHTFFPFPIAMFDRLGFGLPPGFAYATSDGHTVSVFLAWWSCPEGRLTDGVNAPFSPVGSMFAAMPVVPPSDLAGRDPNATAPQLDLLPLVWILSQQLAANHLGGVPGLDDGYVETGDVLRTTDLNGGAAHALGMQAHASFGTFDADAAIQPGGGDNPAARYRMWLVPDEGEITHYLGISNGAGGTLGAGGATLRFQGDPGAGAPPLTVGLSHVVDATDVLVHVVELDP